jgi:hypothetical protein
VFFIIFVPEDVAQRVDHFVGVRRGAMKLSGNGWARKVAEK